MGMTSQMSSPAYRGFEEGNEQLKSDAVRWLRGEFDQDRRESSPWRAHLLDDAAVYDQLR